MQDVITALNADPLDPNKVHVFVDGKHIIAVSLDVAAAEKLTVGQRCPPERLEVLHKAQEMNDIFERALNFLSYRPRSAREVEMRLRKKAYTPEQIDAVMVRLKRLGYVDDREFARFWVTNRMSFSPRGPRLLRSELRQKGVAQEVVDEILAESAENQVELRQQAEDFAAARDESLTDEPVAGTDLANALALARKRMRLLSSLDPQTARRRLSSFLARRGYDYGTIDSTIKRVLRPEDEVYDE
ncbi:MAG TPA: RecX family transcriptional regulator [Chloroflexia bacterium]|nr:RecX family transcriptional regulator [Chloroflexia bacterium]